MVIINVSARLHGVLREDQDAPGLCVRGGLEPATKDRETLVPSGREQKRKIGLHGVKHVGYAVAPWETSVATVETQPIKFRRAGDVEGAASNLSDTGTMSPHGEKDAEKKKTSETDSARDKHRSADSSSKEGGFWATVLDSAPSGGEPTQEDSRGRDSRDLSAGAGAGGSSDVIHGGEASTQANQCQFCHASFSHRSSLYRHVRTMHQKAYPFRCSICHSAFGEKSNLDKHVQIIHERKRPFVCEECNAAFQQRAHLDGHKKTVHLKQRPYRCDMCDAAFGQKPHLSRHVRTVHQKIRPFQCEDCDLKFSERRSLENHKRVKHNSGPQHLTH
mmetsp:Transcript_10201/g.31174  ORF Transcript_10201/g.31174 Transcript_10201/m.31174 type:complete len:332 (+) Transcript_10201:117-1112(+)